MCGHFAQVVKAREPAALYGPAALMPDTAWVERWNGAPTQAFLACRLNAAGRRGVHLMGPGVVLGAGSVDRAPADQRAIGDCCCEARAPRSIRERCACRKSPQRTCLRGAAWMADLFPLPSSPGKGRRTSSRRPARAEPPATSRTGGRSSPARAKPPGGSGRRSSSWANQDTERRCFRAR